MSRYYAFRYSIINLPQTSFFTPDDKKQYVIDFLCQRLKRERVLFYSNIEENSDIEKRNYFLYFVRNDSGLVFIKLAKTSKLMIHDLRLDTKELIDEKIPDKPSIYLVFDLERQIVFIQHLTTVFQQIYTAKNALEKTLNRFFKNDSIEVSINAILEKDKFWEFVDRANKIYEIRYVFQKPNSLPQYYATKEILESLNDTMNPSFTEHKYINNEGNLNPQKEYFSDSVEYCEAGGGSYAVKGEIDGVGKSITSNKEENIKSIEPESIDLIEEKIELFKDPAINRSGKTNNA